MRSADKLIGPQPCLPPPLTCSVWDINIFMMCEMDTKSLAYEGELTKSAMSSQISAVGAGNSGPGTGHAEVYSE